jgi:uncharacterized protein YpiB (UPF0302 family)
MSEVNGPNISVNQLNYTGLQKQSTEQPAVETTDATPQLTDFSDSKAEALGRSMLFKGTDSTNNDLKALIDNPQIAENSDELFESAYNSALENGVENPYEEAASASTTAM